MSKGEEALREILRQEYRQTVLEQHPIKIGRTTLFLDFYIPSLNLAFEIDGIQHSTFIPHFHRTVEGFKDSQRRDRLKSQWCLDQNIKLVRFNHTERITRQTLRRKIASLQQ